ncbi:molecular chaperone [Citrobacter enshiensis]|uniref:fimbrial biogenesis chaperone n=1 Tax=Citrobacter enshiensis TaxID=2971264 RepID=UPI0023E7780F|nr:molecular chaperone [Citrobacter enshiensis]WET42371.1 molecular chaperone [Citrobacter enshiensis]
MRLPLLIVCVTTYAFTTLSHAAGIQVGRTRVIYDANKKEVALALTNTEKELPWLIQSWTDNGDGKTRGPFIVTPPLFRLDPQKEQSLRITWSGQALPTDRESLFYMNVRTIPAIEKDNNQKNVLRLIYKTRLKLFWRPEGLKNTPVDACKNLRFSQRESQVFITNDGDYYSVFDTLRISGKSIPHVDMVAPKANATFPLANTANGSKVTWRCITDYGNATAEFTTRLTQK